MKVERRTLEKMERKRRANKERRARLMKRLLSLRFFETIIH